MKEELESTINTIKSRKKALIVKIKNPEKSDNIDE